MLYFNIQVCQLCIKKAWQEYELVKKIVSFTYLQATPLFQSSFNVSLHGDLLLQEAFLIPAP